MADDDKGVDEAVGYGRPPQHTRFRKGQSGNPGGRLRSRNFAALLGAALDMPAMLVENGRRRRVTKREVIAAQLVDRSAQADLRATRLLIDILDKIEPRREAEPADFGTEDEKVIASLLARLGRAP